jgi:hypothetical protein
VKEFAADGVFEDFPSEYQAHVRAIIARAESVNSGEKMNKSQRGDHS